jgi:hypothetical protein
VEPFFAKNVSTAWTKDCQIFLGSTYQSGEKIPKAHKIYQIAIKIPNILKLYQNFPLQGYLKYNKSEIFGIFW